MVGLVVTAVKHAQSRTLPLLDAWKAAQKEPTERRKGREQNRDKLRTI